jgi:hypothetical protein
LIHISIKNVNLHHRPQIHPYAHATLVPRLPTWVTPDISAKMVS